MNSKDEQEHVEQLDIESLIVDLLACGLGACIVLFFIFSIRVIGKTTGGSEPSSNSSFGSNSGYVSLIGEDGNLKGRMGAIRIVEISGLSDANAGTIKNYVEKNNGKFWRFKWEKDLASTVRQQVKFGKNSVSFILIADGMRELDFVFDPKLAPKLRNDRVPIATIKVIFIEGQAAKGGFNGMWPHVVKEQVDFNDLRLHFGVGKAGTNIGKLIKMVRKRQ